MNMNELIPQAEATVLLGVTHPMMHYWAERKVLKRHYRRGKIFYRFGDILALRDARVGHKKVGRPSGRVLLDRRFAANQDQQALVVEVG